MQLIKDNHIMHSLNEKDETISFDYLTCWKYNVSNYNLYIFSIQLKDEEELLNVYEELRDYIAIYFQSQMLEKNIERWNIYQFFFIDQQINDNIKQKVEQDKFSTRKIIYDNQQKQLLDKEIKNLINKELFEFEIKSRQITKENIEEKLINQHPSVLSLIDEIGTNQLNDSLELILNSLGNE